MGEPVEFEAFCLRQNAALIRFLSLYCGDVETARDITQENPARVWAHRGKVQRMDRPDLWARRVALNMADSQFRRRGVERGRLLLLAERNASPGPDRATDCGYTRLGGGPEHTAAHRQPASFPGGPVRGAEQ